jgi:hypothetical protein
MISQENKNNKFKFIILNDKYYNKVFRNIYSHKL